MSKNLDETVHLQSEKREAWIREIRSEAKQTKKIRQKSREKREKYRAKNGSLGNTSMDSKETTIVILINHASTPIKKERLSPMGKARREASRIELPKREGCQTESKAFNQSVLERIVRESGLGLLNPSEMS